MKNHLISVLVTFDAKTHTFKNKKRFVSNDDECPSWSSTKLVSKSVLYLNNTWSKIHLKSQINECLFIIKEYKCTNNKAINSIEI